MSIGIFYFFLYCFMGIIQCILGGVFLYISSSIKKKKEQFCTKCGREVKEHYVHCPSCGKELHVGYNETAKIIFLVLGIMTIFTGISFFLLAFFLLFLSFLFI